MNGAALLERVRRAAGLSQDELARRAHTSRPTLSAYENGRKSPSLDTTQRLLTEAGYDLDATPHITFHPVPGARGRDHLVPDRLPRLPLEQAMATVELPLTLNWSDPGRSFRLSDRSERSRVYEIVLREGTPDDVLTYIDGALLIDLWSELVLPRDLRTAWTPVIEQMLPTP
ncbi:XRE family transcriptional regulator [Rhodococcus sp. WS4]|nr:XRE family transcriptional regulator [Rhodococcus sp. WS4]